MPIYASTHGFVTPSQLRAARTVTGQFPYSDGTAKRDFLNACAAWNYAALNPFNFTATLRLRETFARVAQSAK